MARRIQLFFYRIYLPHNSACYTITGAANADINLKRFYIILITNFYRLHTRNFAQFRLNVLPQ